MAFALLVAACGSPGSSTGGATTGPGEGNAAPANSLAPTLDLSGNTSTVPIQVANALGCVNIDANAQMDNWVSAEVTCLFDGDNEVTIFSFTSAANEQKWFDLGPESADESGTVIRGDVWAVEPFNESEANAIQQKIGGTIAQQQ
jgi:hypothetical protein